MRKLAGLGNSAFGVDLMKKAFGTTGALTDPGANRGEQDEMRDLFAGAYAVLRSPAGHREIYYDDVSEAAEAVLMGVDHDPEQSGRNTATVSATGLPSSGSSNRTVTRAAGWPVASRRLLATDGGGNCISTCTARAPPTGVSWPCSGSG